MALDYIWFVKRLGLLFSFYAVFLIQLHAIVPHKHDFDLHTGQSELHQENNFLHLLEHLFMFDIGKDHLEHFSEQPEHSFWGVDLAFFALEKPFPIVLRTNFSLSAQAQVLRIYPQDIAGRAPPYTV